MKIVREWEGFPLCSTRDPQAEANKWVSTITSTSEHCWVLGLGSGYHIQTLAHKFPNQIISVVDHRPLLKESFELHFHDLCSQVQVEIASCEEELFRSKSFGLFGLDQSPVHIFRPAIQKYQELYASLSKSLRGQTSYSFQIFLDLLDIHLPKKSFENFKEFQVKEIAQAMGGKGNDEDQRLIKVLRELVL